MTGGGESNGKHGWRLSPWSSSVKAKRSKRWIPARLSPANEPTTTDTSTNMSRQTLLSSPSQPLHGSVDPEESTSGAGSSFKKARGRQHDIVSTSILHERGDESLYLTPPEIDISEPTAPFARVEKAERGSFYRMRSRDPRSPTRTRFREELGSDEKEDMVEESCAHPARLPLDCCSARDPCQRKTSVFALALWFLSIFSTIGSLLWLIVAYYQPRWGRVISSRGSMSPSTASLIIALIAKLIETSFVAVFVATIGQVLTRRAFDRRSRGMTLAEISMRNWVIQPGLMLTDGPALRLVAFTTLGAICLVATIVAVLYTTASDALVSPKLKFGRQEETVLQSFAMASYSNLPFIRESCLIPISKDKDSFSNDACLAVTLSGASYHNFQTYMAGWHDSPPSEVLPDNIMANRPAATSILFDNVTMTAAWIEGQYSNPEQSFRAHRRVINNVTLAMPHPGVYLAATNPINRILQPSDLSGVGEYEIRASSVSPTVNVLCANMAAEELAPLVYTMWPDAKTNETDVPVQHVGWANWTMEVPVVAGDEWLNRTVVDDVFRWGPGYGRRPPVFPMYPLAFNMIINASVYMSDGLYLLAKSNTTSDYTLCEMRSWLSPKCSTQFNISGTEGAHMRAHCEDPLDPVSYAKSSPDAPSNFTSTDWRNLADGWNLALFMNSGANNANASRDRILAQLVLTEPKLSSSLPSFAESLAVLVSSTLVSGSLYTPLKHSWDYPTMTMPAPGAQQNFTALIRTQEYTSSYNNDWQAVFYFVLVMVFILNLLCLVHFAANLRGRPLTDYTDPANLFALAINSPPSMQLSGSCGGGPSGRHLVVPFRVGYSEATNHYYFEEEKLGRDQRNQAAAGDDEINAGASEKKWSKSSKLAAMMMKKKNRSSNSSTASLFSVSPLTESGMSDDMKNDVSGDSQQCNHGSGTNYTRLSTSRSWI
ncbi:hypothetical protein B0H66DRAFT_125301 [Apodospora peruviana]|uniref:Uncharacterized protein n=1 Tax=Apodospora peruviana TaxID=516989 RepID=A0AAE0II12_9PEZI|nr:hypothetical protein B0H66DRAFT_125301 [Apodospora peruviana]